MKRKERGIDGNHAATCKKNKRKKKEIIKKLMSRAIELGTMQEGYKVSGCWASQ